MPIANVNGVELCYETSGNPGDPCLMLVHGYGAQLIQWPTELTEALADAGWHVVFFDNRDVGLSTKFHGQLPGLGLPAPGTFTPTLLGEPPYNLRDMAWDALGLLDHLGIQQAHLVGASLGGAIVQRAALEARSRVLSLTLLMTSTGDPALPPAALQTAMALLIPAPPDRDGYVQAMLPVLRRVWGPSFDKSRAVLQLQQRFDRMHYPEGLGRQLAALVADGDRTAELASLEVPTLVLHGADDTLVPLAHGQAVTNAIREATLEVLPQMGHDLPPRHLPFMAELITAHAAGASGAGRIG